MSLLNKLNSKDKEALLMIIGTIIWAIIWQYVKTSSSPNIITNVIKHSIKYLILIDIYAYIISTDRSFAQNDQWEEPQYFYNKFNNSADIAPLRLTAIEIINTDYSINKSVDKIEVYNEM